MEHLMKGRTMYNDCSRRDMRKAMKMAAIARMAGRWGGDDHGPFGKHGPFGRHGPFGPGGPFGDDGARGRGRRGRMFGQGELRLALL
ncbi:MAG: hypothetical protein ACTHKM_01665, partial [Tsuneonella sp.]